MFDKATRTLMAMLFERSTVDEIDGRLEDGRGWSVNCIRPTPFLDYTFYDGYIAGAYADFRGDTLEETLGKMNAWLEQESKIVVCEVTA